MQMRVCDCILVGRPSRTPRFPVQPSFSDEPQRKQHHGPGAPPTYRFPHPSFYFPVPPYARCREIIVANPSRYDTPLVTPNRPRREPAPPPRLLVPSAPHFPIGTYLSSASRAAAPAPAIIRLRTVRFLSPGGSDVVVEGAVILGAGGGMSVRLGTGNLVFVQCQMRMDGNGDRDILRLLSLFT